jgi:hypothetical protein
MITKREKRRTVRNTAKPTAIESSRTKGIEVTIVPEMIARLITSLLIDWITRRSTQEHSIIFRIGKISIIHPLNGLKRNLN